MRGRPRLARTDQRIMRAALELLRDKGPAALNIEAVAAHSGVARTTIYRRYRNRRELVAAAVAELVEGPFPPPELPMEAKLRWVLEQISDMLEHNLGRGGISAVLVGADLEFTTALRGRIEDRLGTLRGLMKSDVDTGRLNSEADPDALVGLLFGAYLGEILRYGQPRDGWMNRTINLLTRALTVT